MDVMNMGYYIAKTDRKTLWSESVKTKVGYFPADLKKQHLKNE